MSIAPADVPRHLQQLLQMPFPSEPAPPNDWCAWDWYCEFLAHSPQRLIEIIDAQYHDADQSGRDLYDVVDEFSKQYRALLSACEKACVPVFGPGQHLKRKDYRPRSRTIRLGEDILFNFSDADIVYWRVRGRIAMLHFACHRGDGDVQASVCAMVVPDELAPPNQP
jgi:hypothetical protein